jgi:transposase-like protein
MTKEEHTRLVRLRSKLLQHAQEGPRGSVTRACLRFGISRETFYKWKKRFEEHGDAGLGDRSRVPLRSPNATSPEIVTKILYLRQNYHFGPLKISDYLKRFHRVSLWLDRTSHSGQARHA